MSPRFTGKTAGYKNRTEAGTYGSDSTKEAETPISQASGRFLFAFLFLYFFPSFLENNSSTFRKIKNYNRGSVSFEFLFTLAPPWDTGLALSILAGSLLLRSC